MRVVHVDWLMECPAGVGQLLSTLHFRRAEGSSPGADESILPEADTSRPVVTVHARRTPRWARDSRAQRGGIPPAGYTSALPVQEGHAVNAVKPGTCSALGPLGMTSE